MNIPVNDDVPVIGDILWGIGNTQFELILGIPYFANRENSIFSIIKIFETRYSGVTMSRCSQVARPESMRHCYWGHVSELPDMWPVVVKRRMCLIYSNYFRVRWISTDNPLETAIIFYVKSVPGKMSMLSPWPNERWQLEFHKYLASKEVWKHFEYDIFIL